MTPSGYQDFDGIAYMGEKPIYRLELEDSYWVECTTDHGIYIDSNTKIPAEHITPGQSVLTKTGRRKVINGYHTGRIEKVYDLIGVNNGNRFYGNNILISNCEFISVEESLISSLTLATMKGVEPLRRTGQIRWYDDIRKDCAYVVGLDPSMGTGGDPAAIQVYSLPEFKQVAEWQHNKTDVRGQIKILHEILKDIYTELKSLGNKQPEIYWSVENNTLGEAHLIVIDEMGEDLFPGEFLSEPKKSGSTRVYRKGFTTTHGSKSVACMKMKSWIETEKMTPMSKNLIRELKTFIAKGKSYAAKQGEHDDLVTASLLCVRMVQLISQYDEKYEEILGASLDDDSYDLEPMPVVF